MKRFRTKIAVLIGLITAAVGVTLATPAAAPASLGGFFEIVNPVFGGCLDVLDTSTRPGARVQEVHCKNNDAQLWGPLIQPDQVHLLWQNRGSGLCLHTTSAVNGAFVDQQPCNAFDTGQRWQWGGADPIGHLVLISDHPDRCLSLQSSSSADGTRIITQNCATVVAQFFRIDS